MGFIVASAEEKVAMLEQRIEDLSIDGDEEALDAVLEVHPAWPGACCCSIHPSLLTLIRNQHQTGLCVYEVDDPTTRDDTNVDEVIKLQNMVTELENPA